VNAWLLTVLTVGTVLRFTRLINKDTILEPARDYVAARAAASEARRLDSGWSQPDPDKPTRWLAPEGLSGLALFFRRKWTGFWPWLDDLIGCPWCVSVYVAVPAAFVVVWFGDNRAVIAGLLACTASWVAGFVTAHTEES
jgi:hypothetical protein